MYILDLSSLLQSDGEAQQSVFYCNNSILHWKDNLYWMAYRRMQYRLTVPSRLHPWKIWDNGYKYLYDNPERMYLRRSGAPRHGAMKYRNGLSADRVIALDGESIGNRISPNAREFDSTGLALVEYIPDDGHRPWRLVRNFHNIFGQDMNQDARLSRGDHPNEFWITYNGFFQTDGRSRRSPTVRMMKRCVHIIEREDSPSFLYLFEEEELLTLPHQDIEKNCVLHNEAVLYSISKGEFVYHTPHEIRGRTPDPLLRDLDALLRPHGILLSLGTPPHPYRDRYLMAGHLKIPFRRFRSGTDPMPPFLKSFFETIPWDEIYLHGRFLYLMILIEFDKEYCVHRISHALLPTEGRSYLPYLLCFPAGLTRGRNADEILLSYGEGDVRCKLFSFTTDDVETLLHTREELQGVFCSPSLTGPCPLFRAQFLDTRLYTARPRIFHYGYYFEKNAGDDMFMIIFRLLQRSMAPNALIRFRNRFHPSEIRSQDLLVFGGGDIITPYFMNDLAAFPNHIQKHAVSVGVPYTADLPSLDRFDSILLRNPRDLERVRSLLRHSETHKPIEYFPDLGFLLPYVWKTCNHSTIPRLPPATVSAGGDLSSSGRLSVGLSMPRTAYQKDSLDYVAYLESLVQVFRLLLEREPRIQLFLLPFCVPDRKHREDDRILNDQIAELMDRERDRVHILSLPTDLYGVEWIYRTISTMDFMICGRFHAHIFSFDLGVPFVSMASSRKCHELMHGLGLTDPIIRLGTNTDDRPVRIKNVEEITGKILLQIQNREALQNHIVEFYKHDIAPRCDAFLEYWRSFLRTHLPPDMLSENLDVPHDNPVKPAS